MLIVFLVFPQLALAGGYSNWAIPTRIDIERDGGFMIYGAFGNPAGCNEPNRIYVQKAHPQYAEIYSTALAAFSAGKKLQAYVHQCTAVGWYSGSQVIFNTVTPSGVVNVMN
ncbi:MAG: hypothetical protein OQK04_04215 [Kangiellaceae bacterium]|nr:hypothetical protein [Kangiellaceae bacterium]MCW8997899.1 hypothetical protein [Kangiellaceae bacterium]